MKRPVTIAAAGLFEAMRYLAILFCSCLLSLLADVTAYAEDPHLNAAVDAIATEVAGLGGKMDAIQGLQWAQLGLGTVLGLYLVINSWRK